MRWITFATTPLTVEAILTAIAVEIDSDSIDKDDVPGEDSVLWWCSSLVLTDERTGILALSHFTVKDFLVDSGLLELRNLRRYHMDEFTSNAILAKVCLTYIYFKDFSHWHWRDSAAMEQKISKYPFLDYAASFWPKHAQCHDQNEVIFALVCRLLHPQKSKAFLFWLWIYNSFDTVPNFSSTVPTLHIAASFGLYNVCEWLLKQGSDIDASHTFLGTPLMCSIRGGPKKELPNLHTILFLLGCGASANTQLKLPQEGYETPMSLALDCALIDPVQSDYIFKALCNAGAVTSFASSNFWTKAYKLTASGIACMINCFADILKSPATNASLDDESRNQMLEFISSEAALVYEDDEVHQFHFMEALIRNGTNPSTLSLALPDASGYGHVEVVELLLDRCPFDVPEIYVQIQKAWIEATTYEQVEVLKTLVKRGISVDMVVTTGLPEERTGLSCAVYHGALESLDYFEAFPTTDYDMKADGMNLLHLGIRSKNRLEVVKRLLEKGLDPLEAAPNGRSLLHTRLFDDGPLNLEDLEVFQLLVERGCNIEAVDNDGNSLLHVLLCRENSNDKYARDIMLLLLGDGKMKSVQRNDGLLPLNLAVRQRLPASLVRLAIPSELSLWNNNGAARIPILHEAVTPGPSEVDARHMSRMLDILFEVDGINLDILDANENTPLIVAASHCYYFSNLSNGRIFQKLLQKGAAPNIQNVKNGTALHVLAANGFELGVREMLAFKPDLNIRNNRGYLALHEAINGGHLAVTRVLLEQMLKLDERSPNSGETWRKTSTGFTLLYVAVMSNSSNITELLHEAGEISDMNELVVDAIRDTALHCAVRLSFKNVIPTLFKLGADPNSTDANGQALLHIAASLGLKDIADLLIQNGASLVAEDSSRRQPWMIAALNSQKEMKGHLEELAREKEEKLGASQSLRGKDAGDGVGSTFEALSKGVKAIHTMPTADPDKKDLASLKLTEVLKEGVASGSFSICKALLDAGADPNAAVNEFNETALHLACATEWSEIVKLLLEFGAWHDIQDVTGYFPIHAAAERGQAENIRVLAKAGANMHVRSNRMESALHFTAEKGHLEATRAILGLESPPKENMENVPVSGIPEPLAVDQDDIRKLDPGKVSYSLLNLSLGMKY